MPGPVVSGASSKVSATDCSSRGKKRGELGFRIQAKFRSQTVLIRSLGFRV